jgi:hypothetical protein
MLFLIVSHPRPERPSAWAKDRTKAWPWFEPLLADGTCKCVYARTGRGAVAILDVDSHERLHELLNGWSELIPCKLDVYPLIDIAQSKQFLDEQLRSAPPGRKKKP